ncbi:MAG: hypothetical protein WDN69_36200 [Aliidongia sp.]
MRTGTSKPAVAAAGLDLAELGRPGSAAEADRLAACLKTMPRAQRRAGHWGVPLFAFEGEPFFGPGRIDHLLWRMGQRGLARRSGD